MCTPGYKSEKIQSPHTQDYDHIARAGTKVRIKYTYVLMRIFNTPIFIQYQQIRTCYHSEKNIGFAILLQ